MSTDSRFDTRAEQLTKHARFFEYTTASDPIGSGSISPVPVKEFGPELYRSGDTRMIPLDISKELKTDYPASSPSLLAHFITIRRGDTINTSPNATSELYYVIEGSGSTDVNGETIQWHKGDFLTLPAGSNSRHTAAEDASIYYITDSPLLRYLGVNAAEARFKPTLYTAEQAKEKLAEAANSPDARFRNRISVLLNNDKFDQTLTITHVLWAMFGIVPPGSKQAPHSHKSVALDFVAYAAPGTYTLVGSRIDPNTKEIIDPVRVDWVTGKAFITPPGLWHSHHNESGEAAYIIPIQDAGLQTYLRTLDIQFQHYEK
ncbi:cupin domain-containing protein [Bacillus sonorensis]|uniref:cupin domain-containing protein n=1 Tax=Bacillus sonorensis TaxID=119858 RepID=UPI0004961211|nr:cupin domain-containing protein [Bacillus sonorensis]MCF7617561.1 cupin domain-containing protein [Bacillus sonorensis]MCY8088208.1 cupin domain-containing protein [Bacillus sonorensis]MCZ0067228.1 cupin domain-containing protein [Bacillus sonorensis]MCZ0095758.1 cupin domain-containing protein [Bacillus sonorensis]MEC1354790.1 cupin domain-containing protein [Bacillus sonorensis]